MRVAIVVAFATAGIASPQALAYRAAHIVPLVLVGVPALVEAGATRPAVAPTSAAAA
jgi:hypothetical protein